MTDTTTAQALTDDQCEQVAGGNRNFVATTMATGEEEPKRRGPIALDAHLHR